MLQRLVSVVVLLFPLISSQLVNKNVLFIAVDDLRPELAGLYGQGEIATPNIQRLMANGFTFTHAYCQGPLCSPSRTSFLTGLRPDTTRLWKIGPYFRETMPGGKNVTTLTQYFISKGYWAVGSGKIWHPGSSSGGWPGTSEGGGDELYGSWSEPYFFCDQFGNGSLQSPLGQNYPNNYPGGDKANGCVSSQECAECYGAWGLWGPDTNYCSAPSDCDELCYQEGQVVDNTLNHWQNLYMNNDTKPWFIAVGLKRPHINWYGPTKWFDYYDINNISNPSNPYPPINMPPVAFVTNNSEISGCKELHINTSRMYTYYVDNKQNNDIDPGYYRIIDPSFHAHFRRAYYATVSWMDEELGRLLDGLQYFGFQDNTVVTFIGDHGFGLGELGFWNKHVLFELADRVPMIISVPTKRKYHGMKSDHLVESIDLYPTLLDAVGLPPNKMNQGKSILDLITSDGMRRTQQYIEINDDELGDVNFSQVAWSQIQYDYHAYNGTVYPSLMGLSLRTINWRYTQFIDYDYDNGTPKFNGMVYGQELYDHRNEDINNFNSYENENLAYNSTYSDVVQQMQQYMEKNWPH